MKTIDDFIKELQRISPNKRKLPLVIGCPNGEETYPSIKMGSNDKFFGLDSKIDKMIITWQD